ncbi:hypothetical protein AAFF_G00094000 [Aldrovandia affinis]|uniref:Secreted protein n=1 Tax=Aldrovandia affinis TaxID=143900 RepID=A0AAD7T2U8_9TELE|nr:hypothetical protein AAFF_G00094000 [Aldrovandia affinis]
MSWPAWSLFLTVAVRSSASGRPVKSDIPRVSGGRAMRSFCSFPLWPLGDLTTVGVAEPSHHGLGNKATRNDAVRRETRGSGQTLEFGGLFIAVLPSDRLARDQEIKLAEISFQTLCSRLLPLFSVSDSCDD